MSFSGKNSKGNGNQPQSMPPPTINHPSIRFGGTLFRTSGNSLPTWQEIDAELAKYPRPADVPSDHLLPLNLVSELCPPFIRRNYEEARYLRGFNVPLPVRFLDDLQASQNLRDSQRGFPQYSVVVENANAEVESELDGESEEVSEEEPEASALVIKPRPGPVAQIAPQPLISTSRTSDVRVRYPYAYGLLQPIIIPGQVQLGEKKLLRRTVIDKETKITRRVEKQSSSSSSKTTTHNTKNNDEGGSKKVSGDKRIKNIEAAKAKKKESNFKGKDKEKKKK